MSIHNKQLEPVARKFPAATVKPATLTGEGAWYVKIVSGIAEGFYADDDGNEVQITSNGSVNGGSGGGEANTASSIGGGGTTATIVAGKVGLDLQFKGIDGLEEGGIGITESGNRVFIGLDFSKALSTTTFRNEDYAIVYQQDTGNHLRILKTNLFSGISAGLSKEYRLILPAAATLNARIGLVTSLPSGWTLNTADSGVEPQFGSDADTLIITWDSGLGNKIAQFYLWQTSTSGPTATQGTQKIDVSGAADEKTNTTRTKSAVYLNGKGLQTSRDLDVFIRLV